MAGVVGVVGVASSCQSAEGGVWREWERADMRHWCGRGLAALALAVCRGDGVGGGGHGGSRGWWK